jgi:hypothetical protein
MTDKLSDRIEDAYSWLENATGATLNRLDVEEVRQLEQRVEGLEELERQINDLIAESRGVDGLHLNGDLADWDWLINNKWLEALASQEEA